MMRVFILCTGKNGSYSIIKACKHINNYTSGHESKTKKLGVERFNYPDNHIESDNRLSWFLGGLDKKYGDDAIYIHLKRDKQKTINSFNKRWESNNSIISAFCVGILKLSKGKLLEKDRLEVCADYYETVNTNIEHFLKDKSKKTTIYLESIKEGFKNFWQLIGAEGNFEKAVNVFDTPYNQSKRRRKRSNSSNFKLFFQKDKKSFKS